MLLPMYRLADRLGRVIVKSGLKFGDAASGQSGRARRSSPAASASAKPARPVVQLTLTPAQVPVAATMLLLTLGLVAAATLAFDRMTRAPGVVVLVPTLAGPPAIP